MLPSQPKKDVVLEEEKDLLFFIMLGEIVPGNHPIMKEITDELMEMRCEEAKKNFSTLRYAHSSKKRIELLKLLENERFFETANYAKNLLKNKNFVKSPCCIKPSIPQEKIDEVLSLLGKGLRPALVAKLCKISKPSVSRIKKRF